tara:strand:+ start:743 stop:1117 length:375 start_codon:yes stop_codon:yes gene_type:complete
MNISRKTKNDMFLFIVLFFIYALNKYYIRPNYGNTFILGEISGSLPNLIGAFIFSFIPLEKIFRINTLNEKKVIYLRALIIFILLTSEEFFPFFTSSKTFDYFDIFGSGIGILLAIKYIENRGI